MDIAAVFGLKVNLAKTKVMPVGYGITPADQLPLLVAGNTVECRGVPLSWFIGAHYWPLLPRHQVAHCRGITGF